MNAFTILIILFKYCRFKRRHEIKITFNNIGLFGKKEVSYLKHFVPQTMRTPARQFTGKPRTLSSKLSYRRDLYK